MKSNSLNSVKYLAPVLCIAAAGISQTPVLVSANIATSTTWTANNVYRLENQIYVLPGATLTIAAGTLIASTANVGGSLAVCKGAQIYVNGTQSDPVIMTSTSDVATWVGGNPHTGSVAHYTNLQLRAVPHRARLGPCFDSRNSGSVAQCSQVNPVVRHNRNDRNNRHNRNDRNDPPHCGVR